MFIDSGLGVLWWGKAIYNSQMGLSTLSYEMKTKMLEGSWCNESFHVPHLLHSFSPPGNKDSRLGDCEMLWGFPFRKVMRWMGFISPSSPLSIWISTDWVASKSGVHSGIDNKHTNLPLPHFFFFLHGHVTKAADCLKLETERSHRWKTGRINLALQMCPFQGQNYSLPGSSQCGTWVCSNAMALACPWDALDEWQVPTQQRHPDAVRILTDFNYCGKASTT